MVGWGWLIVAYVMGAASVMGLAVYVAWVQKRRVKRIERAAAEQMAQRHPGNSRGGA